MDQKVLTPEVVAAQEPDMAIQIGTRGRTIVISSRETYEESLAITAEAKRRIRILEMMRKDDKELVLEQARKIDARWNGMKAPYEVLIAELTPRQVAWHDAEESARKQAERKALEDAERERARLRRQAEADALKAEAAREAGDERKAEQLEERAMDKASAAQSVVPVIAPPPPKVEGTSIVPTWKASCHDIEALIVTAFTGSNEQRAIARGFLRIEFNQAAANAFARATKGAVNIPGVKFSTVTGIRQ